MGLTSAALSYLLIIVSVGLLGAIIVCWRRLARRDLTSIVLRAVSLIALQVSVLGLIFVTVNRSGEFYSSWSDLFGSDTASASVVASASTSAARIRPVVVTSHRVVRVPRDRAAGGVLQSVRFTGQLSGLTVPGDVFLPRGYRQDGPVGHYPVLVVVSNDLANASSPYSAVRLAQSAARQIAARDLEPLIMIMLPAGLAADDQGCLDLPAQPATAHSAASRAVMAGTFFTEDIPAIMESRYAASNAAANWGLLGDDSGGYCALQLTLSNSWVYSAAVAPDGAYAAPPSVDQAAVTPQLKQQDNLLWLLHSQPMQPVSVLFTGPGFGSSAGKAEPFVTAARAPMHVVTAALQHGQWPLSGVLNWIGEAIGPRAANAPQGIAG